ANAPGCMCRKCAAEHRHHQSECRWNKAQEIHNLREACTEKKEWQYDLDYRHHPCPACERAINKRLKWPSSSVCDIEQCNTAPVGRHPEQVLPVEAGRSPGLRG